MTFQLLLLLLPALSVRSDFLIVGKDFILVFPENIAFYYPLPPQNKLRITALHNATTVTVTTPTSDPVGTYPLESGEVKDVEIKADMELDKANTSNKVVMVTSTKNITLEMLSQRDSSAQSALLIPTDQLGKSYRVPPLPRTQSATFSNAVTERSSFKLIIVNKEGLNQITVDGSGGGSFELKAGQVKQIWVYSDMVGGLVTGDKPFLLLFGHTCAIQFGCTCGVLYTPLLPTASTTSRFIVPEVFGLDTERPAYLLKPSDGKDMEFKGGSIEVKGSLLLQRPGMLMHMIAEADFGSCFAVNAMANVSENWAVIVAPAASTGDVQIGNGPASISNWQTISGTDSKYKYGLVQLNSKKIIIWNKSERMTVWYMAKTEKNVRFGNPAARLSVHPDYRGCVVTPETLEVLQEEMSWKESIKACKARNMSLISLSNKDFQDQVYRRLLALKQDLTELWMGMRKRSYTGKWIWANEDALDFVDWSHGFPHNEGNRSCAQINLTDPSNPGWIDKHCCTPGRPLCYQPPTLLTIRN